MANILQIRSGVTGPMSVSNQLSDDAVAALRAPGDQLVVRDLDADSVPHISSRMIAALGREAPEGEVAAQHRTVSDQLIDEVKQADCIVISAPMYNYGIPSTLKAWFDHVIRAGATFEYTQSGPLGYLGGKQVLVCSGRGASYQGDAQTLDCVSPHLHAMLGFIGITDVRIITAEGLQLGPQAQEEGLAAARSALATAITEIQASLG